MRLDSQANLEIDIALIANAWSPGFDVMISDAKRGADFVAVAVVQREPDAVVVVFPVGFSRRGGENCPYVHSIPSGKQPVGFLVSPYPIS